MGARFADSRSSSAEHAKINEEVAKRPQLLMEATEKKEEVKKRAKPSLQRAWEAKAAKRRRTKKRKEETGTRTAARHAARRAAAAAVAAATATAAAAAAGT